MRRGVCRGKVARECHHQRNRVLGCGDGVAERCIHYDHAGGSRGRHIDVVHADTRSSHHRQCLRRFDHIGSDLRCGAHRDAMVVTDNLEQVFLAQAGPDIGFNSTLPENLEGRG